MLRLLAPPAHHITCPACGTAYHAPARATIAQHWICPQQPMAPATQVTVARFPACPWRCRLTRRVRAHPDLGVDRVIYMPTLLQGQRLALAVTPPPSGPVGATGSAPPAVPA